VNMTKYFKSKNKYIRNTRKYIMENVSLETANSLSDSGHINKLRVVKISSAYLQ
jgi:hypothetical protein